MENVTGMDAQKKSPIETIIETVKQVITNPVGFYRNMPKVGGFVDPLIFAVVLGAVCGVVDAVVSVIRFGSWMTFGMVLRCVIAAPIGALIGGFIGAAIMFVIWKLMDSKESYETAYRCGAYSMAIMPVMYLPYVGIYIYMGWSLYLVVTASIEVHGIPAKKAWKVFGIITGVCLLLMLTSYSCANKVQRNLGSYSQQTGKNSGKNAEDMTPEEAGKAAGEAAAAFMKAMQENAAKQQAKDE